MMMSPDLYDHDGRALLEENAKRKGEYEMSAKVYSTDGIVEVFNSKFGLAVSSVAYNILVNEMARLREQLEAAELLKDNYHNSLMDAVDRAESAEAKLKTASEQEPVYFVYDGSDVGDGWSAASKDEYDATPEEWRKALCAAPIQPADVRELQAKYDRLNTIASEAADMNNRQAQRIAELECALEDETAAKNTALDSLNIANAQVMAFIRKLAAQQARILSILEKLGAWNDAFYVDSEGKHREELNTLLAQAREEGRKEAVPDGWQLVPKELDSVMVNACCIEEIDSIIELDVFLRDLWTRLLASVPTPGEK